MLASFLDSAIAEAQDASAVRVKNPDVLTGESKVAVPVFRIAFEKGLAQKVAELQAITTEIYFHLETHLKNAGFTVVLQDRLRANRFYAALPDGGSPAEVTHDRTGTTWLYVAPTGMPLVVAYNTEADQLLRQMARDSDGEAVLAVSYYVTAQGEITRDSMMLFYGHQAAQCRENCPSAVAQLDFDTTLDAQLDGLAAGLKQANIAFVREVAKRR